jgi:hypothetical protein
LEAAASSANSAKKKKKARTTTAEKFSPAFKECKDIPDDDKGKALEQLDPFMLNRIRTQNLTSMQMDILIYFGTQVAGNRALIFREKDRYFSALAMQHAYLGYPFRKAADDKKTLQAILEATEKELGFLEIITEPEASYVLHRATDPNDSQNPDKQYVFNGKKSVWLPPSPLPFNIFLTDDGKPYLSNGTTALWAKELFEAGCGIATDVA